MIESDIEEREVMPGYKTLGSLNGDIVSRLEAIADLINELEPKLKSFAAEVSPTVNTIKANLDRDETLILIERLSSNMGTLNEMVSFMEALNDLRQGLEPKLKSLMAEVSPTANAIKANIDKDETLLLIQRLTSNMGNLNEMVSFVEALSDMRRELEPKLKALAAEVSPTVNAIKANIDKDETLILVQRLTSNMGTLNEMLSLMEALNDLRVGLEPKLKGLMAEVSPTINALRSFMDNEKTWNMVKGLANSVKEFTEEDVKPMSPLGLISALRDPDIQRATGFLMQFLKKLGQGLKTTT